MEKIKRVLWLTFCEADEKYLDLSRIAFALAILGVLGFSGWTLYAGSFSISEFCTGISTVLFGGGTGIGLRARLEDGLAMIGIKPDPTTTKEGE